MDERINHKWSANGIFGRSQICKKCGFVKRTYIQGRIHVAEFVRLSQSIQRKTPSCDETWPNNWKPCDLKYVDKNRPAYQHTDEITYSMYIGQQGYYGSGFSLFSINCIGYKSAMDHINQYGTPRKITMVYENDNTLEFVKWIVNLGNYPNKFTMEIEGSTFLSDDPQAISAWLLMRNFTLFLAMPDKEPIIRVEKAVASKRI